jgi:hypothetical protein
MSAADAKVFSGELARPVVQGDAVNAPDSAEELVSLGVSKIDVGPRAGLLVRVEVAGLGEDELDLAVDVYLDTPAMRGAVVSPAIGTRAARENRRGRAGSAIDPGDEFGRDECGVGLGK